MLANYGYKDGSGEYYITINTDNCNGCEKCLTICPANCFEVGEDPNDPLREEPVAFIKETQRKKLKDVCSQCKPNKKKLKLPCTEACTENAIKHSW